ncbi:MAG: hypothetical protein K0S76_2453 [Herbinix sp.]|jgi:putative nucleotidyltransferase with HDIG domain|nr:hypothetical protein [Herbinix sp.]
MKAGNREQKPDGIAVKGKGGSLTIIHLLPVISMVIAVVPGLITRNTSIELYKIGILTFILTTASAFYIRWNAEGILNKKLSKTIISVCYMISIVIMMLIDQPEIISVWMIGGLIVSMLIDSKLGLFFQFNLTFILGISDSIQLETVIYLLLMGALLSLLATPLRQKSSAIYAAVILLSTNITISFVVNNFLLEEKANSNYLKSFFSIFAVLVTAFLLCFFYDRFVVKQKASNEQMKDGSNKSNTLTDVNIDQYTTDKDIGTLDMEIQKEQATTVNTCPVHSHPEEAAPSASSIPTRTSYELLNEEGNLLLKRLKVFSESLYEHSLKIGDLSYRAALEIGADAMLAKAGGYYHEIGKLNGKNYIEEGLKLAEEYAFPKELILILKQHNIKFDKPTSVEAAIVMLSDNVVSTIEYIVKSEDAKFTPNKVIDNIFQLRMEKGTFDSSGLSVKDYKQLKEFYQREFQSLDTLG